MNGAVNRSPVVLAAAALCATGCAPSAAPPTASASAPLEGRAIETVPVEPGSFGDSDGVRLEARFELEVGPPSETVGFVELWALPWEAWPAVRLPASAALLVLSVAPDAGGAAPGAAGPPGAMATMLSTAGIAERRAADSPVSGWGWAGIASVAGTERLLAVLDWRVEDPGWEVVVVSSPDGGRSWRELSRVHKPHYLATVDAVSLEPDGRGTLDLLLDDCADCGVGLGHYVHDTTDGGLTWALLRGP